MVVAFEVLKVKGLSLLERLLQRRSEVFISVRGRKRYVVLTVEEYARLKRAEVKNVLCQAAQTKAQPRLEGLAS